jgi:hypothetical protein
MLAQIQDKLLMRSSNNHNLIEATDIGCGNNVRIWGAAKGFK